MRAIALSVLLFSRILAAMPNIVIHPISAAQEREIHKEVCKNFIGVTPPRYHVVRQWRADINPMPILFVSLKASDITRESVLRLSCGIGKEYSSERALDMYIFDDRHAAMAYSPGHEGNTARMEKSLRAVYEFSRKEDYQRLDWRPDPNQPSKWIRIDLGKAPDTSK